MKFFLDTADLCEIEQLNATGLIDGVTTNPSIIAKSGQNFLEVIAQITKIIKGDVSAECVSLDFDKMLKEAHKLAKIADNVVIKVPLSIDGLKVCKTLAGEGIGVNVTLCFSCAQALLAGKAGAKYISPFVGRHDDWGRDGMELIEEIRAIYDNYEFPTEILVASARDPIHVIEAAKIGADVITLPTELIKKLYKHPFTDIGLDAFNRDWQKSGQKIL